MAVHDSAATTSPCTSESSFPSSMRVAYIETEDLPKWTADQFMLRSYAKTCRIPLSQWDSFDATKGELPTATQLRDYACICITGSHYNVSDAGLPWLAPLFQMIREAAALPSLRVLAICFGCQAVATALGGEVSRNPQGFVYGAETVQLEQDACEKIGRLLTPSATLPKTIHAQPPTSEATPTSEPALTPAPTPAPTPVRPAALPSLSNPLLLLASHGEQVSRLPPSSVALGASAGSPNEFFVTGSFYNILCCQSHPEFEPADFVEKISTALIDKGVMDTAQVREAELGFTTKQLHAYQVRELMHAWLVAGRPTTSAADTQ